MTAVGGSLAIATAATAAAVMAAMLLRAGPRRIVAGVLTAVAGTAGMVAGLATLASGERFAAGLPGLLPFAGVRLELDSLGAIFMIAVAIVAVPASIFGISYTAHGLEGRAVQTAFPLFVWSMLFVPVAGSASTFLVLWELMALSSLLLLLADHQRNPDVASASHWYAAMTHLGLVAILLALLLLGSQAGGDSFEAMRRGAGAMSPVVRSGIFLLALVGFGSKAGMVPLHVWLPRAHPEAPSHVSALMSGAMVKLGIYGLLRVSWDLLGGGPRWWGVTVLAMGILSAVFGILHALVASDLKRLLAYSTTENIGLILVGIGAAGVLATSGNRTLAAVAVGAALLHVLNHAAFKGLLFLGAGSVLAATGIRDLDRLGGLLRRMPVTGATFAIGALAIAALPPLNGFVSEWLLLQALVHSLPSEVTVVAVIMPFAVAAVALTGGLAVATFVKALGTGFLARPRSSSAQDAVESPVTMQMGLVMLAGLCVLLGVAPTLVSTALTRAVAVLRPLSDGPPMGGDRLVLAVDGIGTTLSPVLLATALAVMLTLTLLLVRWARSAAAVRSVETWGCGRSAQTARMEYTATSFAEPLQRVFDEVLRPDLDVDVSHRAESHYYIEAVRYSRGIHDAFERWMYEPILRWAGRLGRAARALQNGSIHRYLGYGLVALIAVLVVAR